MSLPICQDESDVRDALGSFIRDFNNLDMASVASYFAQEATMFPRSVMSDRGTEGIDLADYCREPGPAPFQNMEEFAAELRASGDGPPFMNLEPSDIMIQILNDAAVVTFHLKSPTKLARRTIVFVKRLDTWKIIHLHASNVQIGS